jgi:uncharacterized protein (TIGR02266 family)
MENCRRAPRISTDLKLVSRNSGNSIDTRINMSSGGLFIKTNHLLPVDAEFPLNLQLPGDPEIMTIKVRVVWTKSVASASPAGMGIEFINILPEHENKILVFVEEIARENKSKEAVKMYV